MTFEKIQRQARAAWEEFASGGKPRVLIGAGTCGKAAGADEVLDAIRAHLGQTGREAGVTAVGCLGMCYVEPLVELARPGAPSVLYGSVKPDEVPRLLDGYLRDGDLLPDRALAVMDGPASNGIPAFSELPMLKGQVRIAMRNCGVIDPENIYHYIARGGYSGLVKALSMSPSEVIEEVKKSGLRGRGGAGFPTAVKWDFCRKSPGDEKYLVCNADEGDPGAFMDRSVFESDPHAVLEGMAIAAYAIGARHGYVYVRMEYPLVIERLKKAIARAEEIGLLGDNILGSGFSFHLKIKMGAGAFVCGEETALIASIEGRRGMPRSRPPFPAQEGLFGKPTNINNVETFANVSAILAHGGEWFAQYGTETSRGTKTFALTGKIVRTGLIEVPMGITLRDIIYDIGGGIPDGKQFKAVQTGGPSGGCIPASLLDMPVDYEKLTAAGAIMGSGGMVVMDEETCMVDVARYFVEFTRSESCGKCVPCRLGTRQMLTILDGIAAGNGKMEDLALLERMGAAIKKGSLCGLGQTAPNPVLTSLRYFREEYEAHIPIPEWGIEPRCPAMVCRRIVGAPCRYTCPAGVDAARYIRCIADERYRDAVEVVRERIPFPAVCGLVCFHPCEVKCRRGQIDEPIAIRALKGFAVENAAPRRRKRPPRPELTGKRVAIVGSGPAGLTAAYYLSRKGRRVTVFEREAQPGGTLWTGIPAFRLPRKTIKADIAEIRKAGARIRTNAPVASVDKLFQRGYDAVLLAYGAMKTTKMGIPGEDAPQVHDVLSFLRRANMGERPGLGEQVAVIGGGSSAMDAAATALRLGAREVIVLYRRTRAEMPAALEEIEEALAEGIRIEFLTAPVEIKHNGAGLTLKCIRMELGPEDDSGRRRPVPIPGSEYERLAAAVIMAIGQTPEPMPKLGCETDRWGCVPVDARTFQTNRPGVFAAGDVVTGPSSIIEAIAGGRRAAIAMDRYLGGDGNITEVIAPPEENPSIGELDEATRPRAATRKRAPAKRVGDFEPIELGFDEKTALAETARCLRCDLQEEE